jgi:DNA-binding CsgD family transcriptional regulator
MGVVPSPGLVGRDEELGVLTALVEQGGAAFVLGEPGIGKSRLVTEAADHASSLGMRVLRGRARANDVLRPVSEALLSLARDGGLPEDPELAPYRPALARFAPEWRDSTALDEPLLLVAEGLLRLLGVLGRGTGCVLILEDLHDADPDTVTVLDHVVGNLAARRVAVIGTARHEPGLLSELTRGGRAIELGRLDRIHVRELAAACLGVAPETVSDAVADRLFRDSEGVPFVVGELVGHGCHLNDTRVVPATVVHSVVDRVQRLGLAELLTVAAVFGRRFPLPVLEKLSGLGRHDLLLRLRPAVASRLIGPDHLAAEWYSFRHALTARALLAQVGRCEQAELARRAAEAMSGLSGEWRTVAAELWLMAGDVSAARRLFTDAGRRALVDGAAVAAVPLLRRAYELRTDCGDRISVLVPLLTALAEAGELESALDLAPDVDEDLCFDDSARALLHVTLARVAMRAGLSSRADDEAAAARRLLGPDAPPELVLRLDLIAATDERALHVLAEATRLRLPELACEALERLGILARDLADSDACFRRMAELAHRHRLPSMRLRSLARAGFNDILRSGDDARLRQAGVRALEIGAITEGHLVAAELVTAAVMRGEFVRANELADDCLPAVTRLGLRPAVRTVLIAKAVMSAQRGQRSAMARSLVALDGQFPLVQGVCDAFCALAEEDRRGAVDALDRAIAAESSVHDVLTEPYGLRVLLGVLEGETGLSCVQSGSAWSNQFLLLARAVQAGRDGRPAEADAAMAEHGRLAAPFALARCLGLRLAAEAALADGWGEPANWLREAEEYFHLGQYTALTNACRTLLRQAGSTATQRRCVTDGVPARLRAQGITVREHEVLRLLAERLGNTEIATRLYISPRTVEKHVASLLAKTGELDRTSLHRFAIDHLTVTR